MNDFNAFEISESADGSTTVLALTGELDLATAQSLQDRLDAAHDSGEAVTVDLAPLRFIDSSGLRVLLAASLKAREGDWPFTVRHGTGVVRRIFETAGVEDLIPFES